MRWTPESWRSKPVLQMPTVAWNFSAALAVGLLFSQPILRLKIGFRMIRWQWNRAWVNPGLSLAEDLLAGGATLLAFHGTLPPMTIPSYVFIDAEGRIAARALDSISRTTLYTVVEEVLGRDVPEPRAEAGGAAS